MEKKLTKFNTNRKYCLATAVFLKQLYICIKSVCFYNYNFHRKNIKKLKKNSNSSIKVLRNYNT